MIIDVSVNTLAVKNVSTSFVGSFSVEHGGNVRAQIGALGMFSFRKLKRYHLKISFSLYDFMYKALREAVTSSEYVFLSDITNAPCPKPDSTVPWSTPEL